MKGQGIHCGHNSFYSFIPILSKLHWCFGHSLKICMWLRYNPQIIFVIFLQVELSHISSIIYNKVNGQGIPCGRNSSYSFIPILLKLHWCFGHGLKICMWFGYNPQIFLSIFSQVELSHFYGIIYNNVNGQGIPCGRNSSYSFYPDSFEFSLVFWSWSEEMHVVRILSSDYFLLLFSQDELNHFSGLIYNTVKGQGIHCGHHLLQFYTNSFQTSLVFWS